MAKLALIPLQQTSLTLLPDLKGSCPFPIIKWSGMTSTGIIAKSVPRSQVTLNACSLRVIFYLVHTAHTWPTHNLRPFHVCFEETILYVLLYYALKKSIVGNLHARILLFPKNTQNSYNKCEKGVACFLPAVKGMKKQISFVLNFCM